MRVLVCGGRDYGDNVTVYRHLTEVYADLTIDRDRELIVVHGNAAGADTAAHEWAVMWHRKHRKGYPVQSEPHPAKWKHCGPECPPNHKRTRGVVGSAYCPTAGFRRNQEMIETGVGLVLAFPGGSGTADMVRRATAAGVEVRVVGT